MNYLPLFGAFGASLLTLMLAGCAQAPRDRLTSIQAAGVLVAGGVAEPGQVSPPGEWLQGTEVVLMREFGRSLGVTVRWRHFADRVALKTALGTGKLDVAVGLWLPLGSKTAAAASRQPSIAYGPIYAKSRVVTAYKRGQHKPRSSAELAAGRWLRPSDLPVLSILQQPAAPKPHNAAIPAQLALAAVAARRAQATLTTLTQLHAMQVLFPRLGVAHAYDAEVGTAWAVPAEQSHSLRRRLLLFFRSSKRDGTLQRSFHTHTDHLRNLDRVALQLMARHQRERLQTLRSLFDKAAAENGLTSALLSAVAYQESHWDANAVSPTGVRGLMMLTRATAKSVGVSNRRDPAESIAGGARYLRKLLDRFETEVSAESQQWFALAAYNVGRGHVLDAMRLTEQAGKNPRHWPDVRKFLALLDDPAWHTRTRYGFARGKQAVLYVRNIRRFHDALAFKAVRQRLANSLPHSLSST